MGLEAHNEALRAPMPFQQDLLSQGKGWPSPGLQLPDQHMPTRSSLLLRRCFRAEGLWESPGVGVGGSEATSLPG